MAELVEPTKKKRKRYTKEEFEEALRWAREGNASCNYIAKITGVPAQTLRDNLRGLHVRGQEGRGPLFSEAEEKLIEEFIFMRQRIHRPICRFELLDFLGDWLKSDPRRFRLGADGRPSNSHPTTKIF